MKAITDEAPHLWFVSCECMVFVWEWDRERASEVVKQAEKISSVNELASSSRFIVSQTK